LEKGKEDRLQSNGVKGGGKRWHSLIFPCCNRKGVDMKKIKAKKE
jgi:hypothetical protein